MDGLKKAAKSILRNAIVKTPVIDFIPAPSEAGTVVTSGIKDFIPPPTAFL